MVTEKSDMAYEDLQDLARRKASDKEKKHLVLLKDGCHTGLASITYKFFDKKSKSNGIKNEHPLDFSM